MAMTWSDWHKAYDDPESALSARLRVVQRGLRAAIDGSPAGPMRLVSVCAGQGHDVVGALEEGVLERMQLVCVLARTGAGVCS